MICEIKSGNDIYVLWNGQWCRIAKKFADKLRKEIDDIPVGKASLPAKTKIKREAQFLQDVVAKNSDFALMDQDDVWCDNAGSEIEACDLFSIERQFIHVKRRSHGASGLSHLFAQGRNAAEAFLKDESFRKALKSKLNSKGTKFGRKIPLVKPNPESFEVV